ncbi:MAG: MoxR family ATPase [Lachnospiraceae bacterium]|nr:MoxR family ATPase [Lachnospiraceae bacterium]
MEINQQDIIGFSEDFKAIEEEIGKAIIGQKGVVRNVLCAMIAGGNVLLEGQPGLGKTQLVKTIGRVLDMDFSRIQFTPDLMLADVTGTNVVVKDEKGNSFQFQKGPVFANIVLADEINRATPKTQSSLLEAMQERTVTSGTDTFQLPKPFFVLATQNPIEQEGTYPLPEAQMDRFLFKLDVDFPTKEELFNIVLLTTGTETNEVKKVFGQDKIIKMGEVAREVPLAKAVGEYVMELIIKTHPESDVAPDYIKKYVRFGASPRGAQAIVSTAKIYALLNGRYNVAFDDVKAVALSALRHRMFLNFEAITDGVTADMLIEKLLKEELK